jgi:hypothetical protein
MRWICVFSLSLYCGTAQAQAFGVEMGAPVSRYEGSNVAQSPYYFRIKVPQPNAEFETYAATATPETGICKVSALGKTYHNDDYGTGARTAFDRLASALAAKYGSPQKFDFLRVGALWDKPREWVWSIYKNERTLAAFWTTEMGSALPQDVEGIRLDARSVNAASGAYVTLAYEFSNFPACKKVMDRSDNNGL